MKPKLTDRDKKALIFGAVGLVIIAIIIFAMPFFDNWLIVKRSLARNKEDISKNNLIVAKIKNLQKTVPAFKLPVDQDTQKILFRNKFAEQLKKNQINGEVLKFAPVTKSPLSNYKLLSLKFKGKGKFDNILNLFVDLRANPYFVSIEDFKMVKADLKKPESKDFDIEFSVSTFYSLYGTK